MLFHSSVRKELARSFGATLVVLVTVVMTMTLIRTLNQAARGSINPSEVALVLGYLVIGTLPLTLALSLFVACVSTLSRMYRDSEMVIWFASGRGLASLVGPLLRFAWPVLVVIALLSLVVWPWSNQQTQDLRERYGRRGDLERVAPGQFMESASGSRVFFLDKDTPDNRSGRNIFIATQDRGLETVTSARSGEVVPSDDGQTLLLFDGQRMERRSEGTVRISEFERYSVRIGDKGFAGADRTPAKFRSTLDLAREPTPQHLGELAWRIGMAVAAFNFVLIAVAIAHANPRMGRSGNLLLALFSFIVYHNLLNLGQAWIANGQSGFAAHLLGLHGGVLALALMWLARRHLNWSWRDLLPRRAAA
ncbi:MAG: LPS export ABC transporter permease LptF [Burkholderiaceae bacterium]